VIVVAVDNAAWDPGLVQPRDASVETELRLEITVGAVVNIAGEKHEGHTALEGQFHDTLVSVERGPVRGGGHSWVGGPQSAERSPQMQIGGVDESEWFQVRREIGFGRIKLTG
jgi:hypothetical protein